MAELQERSHFFVQLISSAEKIGLVKWWRDLWDFGTPSYSLTSHDLHYSQTVEECRYGDSPAKNLTSKDCSQK